MKKRYINYTKSVLLLSLTGVITISLLFTSCEKDENTQSTATELLSYGPMPVMRGAELRFIGNNLQQVTAVVLPNSLEIAKSEFTEHSNSSIKLTVPQEAEPGQVKLVSPDGEIIAKTPIGYAEPITFDSFAPASAKPGSEITITGDYLNNVYEVILSNRVVVMAKDFVSHERKEIKLLVPVEAQTGKIAVSDGAEDPNIIYSKLDLTVSLPVIESISPNPLKAGGNLVIKGTDLDLATSMVFGGDKIVTKFEEQSETEITVVVPVDSQDGKVTLMVASGVEIEVGDITLVEPTAVIEDMKDSYGVDETVVIDGTDLDLVTTATFTGAEDTPVTLTDGKINLKVTAAAQSGSITLTTANGTTVTVDGFATTKPVATLPSDATPLDELNIVSTLGSRVKTVMFGELDAEATATSDGFKVIVPLEAETGSVSLVMDNGETVDAGSMTINSYTFCAVSEFVSETTTVGDLLECSVVNGENLTNVFINDANTEYLLVGTVLYVAVGVNVGDNKLTLVSGTTNVDYTIKVEASGIVETVLYNTPTELANWSANHELNIDFSGAPAGSQVRIRYTKTNDSPQMKVFDGHWGNVFNGSADENPENAALLAASDYIDLPISLFPYSDWGYSIILQGDGMIVSSISWVYDYSPPVAIWEGSADVSGWSTSFTALTWGGYDFSGLMVGQTMYVYYTSQGDGDMRLGNGNWAALPSTIPIAIESGDDSGDGNIKITAGTYSVSFVLTAEDIASIQDNGGFGAYGGDYTVTKVALK